MANQAVNHINLQQVQNIANMAWIEAYLDDKKTEAELKQAVKDAMESNKVDISKYKIEVTEQGVTVNRYILNKALVLFDVPLEGWSTSTEYYRNNYEYPIGLGYADNLVQIN